MIPTYFYIYLSCFLLPRHSQKIIGLISPRCAYKSTVTVETLLPPHDTGQYGTSPLLTVVFVAMLPRWNQSLCVRVRDGGEKLVCYF